MEGRNKTEVHKIILTASGGPFFWKGQRFSRTCYQGNGPKPSQLSMGPKITIDSATLMNKGLEVIEAYYLYGMNLDKIEVAIHRESIIHSMVEFCDRSIIAQMGIPDMRLPIAYCLNFPKRMELLWDRLDLFEIGNLSFFRPDTKMFPMLRLATDALRGGQSFVIALNASNEVAVDAFLSNRIKFLDIVTLNKMVLDNHRPRKIEELEDILEIDVSTRTLAQSLLKEMSAR